MVQGGTEVAVSPLPRVLLVGPRMEPPFYGGVEKGIDLLLRSSLGQETQMRLFNNYRPPVRHRPVLSRLGYLLRMVRALRKELKARPVDLVHVKTSVGNNFHQNALYALAAKRMGFPVILQIHSGRFEQFYRKSRLLKRAWIRTTMSSVDRVAVLSSFWKDQLNGLALDARLAVVPNGLGETELASLGEPGNRRFEQVLFIGSSDAETTREKGLSDLLAVMPELLSRHSSVRWVLAGLPDPEGTRQQFASALDAGCQDFAERVRFLGATDGVAKTALLRECSILALPSYFEGMPNLLLEAMAAGMGVVASRVGAIPEMLGQVAGGILIQPGHRGELQLGLHRLLSDPALVQEQGERNRTTVAREYTMSVVQEKLEKLYKEVAGSPRSRHAIRYGEGLSPSRVRGKAL